MGVATIEATKATALVKFRDTWPLIYVSTGKHALYSLPAFIARAAIYTIYMCTYGNLGRRSVRDYSLRACALSVPQLNLNSSYAPDFISVCSVGPLPPVGLTWVNTSCDLSACVLIAGGTAAFLSERSSTIPAAN